MTQILKEDSLKKNLVLQFFYQAIVLVMPLIVAPIVSRRIGSVGLGIYSYVGSIAYYFVVIANLGIVKHGQRVIASSAKDITKLRKTFWSLFSVHLIISTISLLLYSLFIIFCVNEYIDIFCIFGLLILSACFDITWLFYGIQNFKSVVVKNLICRICVSLAIIVFVRNSSDLHVYSIIENFALLVANLALIPSAIKAIRPIRISLSDCAEHVKPLLILSIAVIATALYTVFDKTLLGVLSTKSNVAFYEYSNKIITIPRTFVAVIGTVFFPKACSLAAKGDINGRAKYAEYAYVAVSFISFASIFGLLAIAPALATIYYGEEFASCGDIIISMSPLIFIIGIGDVIRNIFLIPQKKDLPYVVCLCISALLNILLSMILIPYKGVYGAVIGTTIAELFGLVFQFAYCKKQISLKPILKAVGIFSIIGLFMFFIIFIFSFFFKNSVSISYLLFSVLLGALIYCSLSLFLIKHFYQDIWTSLVTFIHKLFERRVAK